MDLTTASFSEVKLNSLEEFKKREQFFILLLCAFPLLASFLLRVENDRVIFPLINQGLSSLCLFRNLFGIDCPFCGLSRSFIEIAHLNFSSAIYYNTAGIVVFIFILLQVPYRIYFIVRPEAQPSNSTLISIPLYLILGAVLIQWLIKIFYL